MKSIVCTLAPKQYYYENKLQSKPRSARLEMTEIHKQRPWNALVQAEMYKYHVGWNKGNRTDVTKSKPNVVASNK